LTGPVALQSGVYYHIYSRGVNCENGFIEDRNYYLFLTLFAKHCVPVVDTFAYCLLRNHFHFFVRIKTKAERKNLLGDDESDSIQNDGYPSHQFSVLLNAYAKTINKVNYRSGSLFQHPFRRLPVTNRTYFKNLICYIHQNPQHHGFVKDFRDWPFSSFHDHLASKETFINRRMVLKFFQDATGYTESHAKIPELSLIKPLVLDDFF
jgi:putative transposase